MDTAGSGEKQACGRIEPEVLGLARKERPLQNHYSAAASSLLCLEGRFDGTSPHRTSHTEPARRLGADRGAVPHQKTAEKYQLFMNRGRAFRINSTHPSSPKAAESRGRPMRSSAALMEPLTSKVRHSNPDHSRERPEPPTACRRRRVRRCRSGHCSTSKILWSSSMMAKILITRMGLRTMESSSISTIWGPVIRALILVLFLPTGQ